jgi:carboxymethylenebutenolidase
MRFMAPSLLICLIVLNSVDSLAQTPQRLSAVGISPGVWGVVETPRTPGCHPAVVILPGSFGWRPAYAQIARTFADSGFLALAIDYFAETGRDTVKEDRLRKWPLWQAMVRNAVAFLQTSPSVSNRHVGLVGYSRGAFLAVSVASSLPTVTAVVDFFGGGGAGTDSLEQQVRHFPPLLILHGEADTVVSVSFAYRLRDAVIAQGGEVEMHLYPGAQHAFNAPFSSAYSEPEASDSWRRTVDFLRRRLGD